MRKLIPITSVVALVFVATTGAFAQGESFGERCQSKKDAIIRQISEAKAHGQTSRVKGLQRALSEVESGCSESRLEAEDAQRIRRQEKKVAERRRELEEAERDGKPRKIEKQRQKLEEEERELQKLRTKS